MELVLKVVGMAMITVVCYQIIKKIQPDLSGFVLIAGGILILLFVSESFFSVIESLFSLTETTYLSGNILKTVIKIIGIGYFTEYSSSICQDLDCHSIAKKVELTGKISILLASIPILNTVFSLVKGLL